MPQQDSGRGSARGKCAVNLSDAPVLASRFDPRTTAQALTARRAAELRGQWSLSLAAVYVLIDPVLGDPVMTQPLPQGLSLADLNDHRSQVWGRASHALALPPGVVLDSALAPYLVELDAAEDPWLDITVGWAVQEAVASWTDTRHEGVPHRVGGWLQSAAPTPELTRMLSAWLTLSTEAATTARYLRVADRRVWSLMVHVLGAGHVAERLTPIQHWHWLDAHAAWQGLCAAAHADAQEPADPQPLARFSKAQWAVMAQGPAIHAHIAQHQARRVMTADVTVAAQSAPVSDAQWRAAVAHAGLKNKTDQEGRAP
ncbi:hypothetical protein C1704_02175 [Caldimonas caldifontis]|uniref:DUF4123 domain-containing protein n=1 Tax=Caldimonas caldifontis TaxID=1452508 RepID=A0A2S5SYB1_9BURK|nr:hypothetical protein C1704_02175 [Caldimonas caldifontis]